jgi:hypothetical protein
VDHNTFFGILESAGVISSDVTGNVSEYSVETSLKFRGVEVECITSTVNEFVIFYNPDINEQVVVVYSEDFNSADFE